MTRRFSDRRQAGLSLIELIIFIVIVSVALVGVLSALNVSVRSSADPVIRKQALAVAEAMLEEVLSKDFQNDVSGNNAGSPLLGCTPSTIPSCRTNTVLDRQNYNDVDDFNGWDQVGVPYFDGTLAPIPGNYRVKVVVAAQALSGVLGKMVTVTVVGGTESIMLSGFRANF